MDAMDKCDEVLKFFLVREERCHPEAVIEDQFRWNEKYDWSDLSLQHIIRQLLKDEYIYIDRLQVEYKGLKQQMYCLSTSGEMFIANGGYKGQYERNKRKEQLEITRLNQANKTHWIVFWISIGAFIVSASTLVCNKSNNPNNYHRHCYCKHY